MSQKQEYRVSLGWIDTALIWIGKLLWFLLALGILVGIGMWLSSVLSWPGWVPIWIQTEAISFTLTFAYIMWRLQGGKIKFTADELVIKWRKSSKD